MSFKKISKKCKLLMKYCINKYENIIWKKIDNNVLKSNSKQNIIYVRNKGRGEERQ
jgi:hypothetical protein